MPKSSLRRDALNNYKNAPISSWILGLVTGVLITAILAFDLLVPALSLLTFPFIILPIIFTASLQHILLKNKETQITVRTSIRGFGLYYSHQFRGCFSVISSLIGSVVVFLVFEMTISFISSYVFMSFNPDFMNSVDGLYELFSDSAVSFDAINNALHANNNFLFNYLTISTIPALFIAIIYYVYCLSRNSMVLYYSTSAKTINMRFSRLVHLNVLRGQRMKLMREYLSLNWPLYVLLLLGLVGGGLFAYFIKEDFIAMITYPILFGSALSIFFLPFYFSNQEALFEKHQTEYFTSSKAVADMFMNNIQQRMEMTQEEKENFEKNIKESLEEQEKDIDDKKE